MSESYDCLVVGAGPAGSAAAGCLAARGLRTALLEKACFPRFKCCAGGIPRKLPVTGFPGGSPGGAAVRGAVFSWRSRRGLEILEAETLGWVVARENFDERLARAAVAAGAELIEGFEVREVREAEGGVEVSGAPGKLRGRVLIACDGAAGRLSRGLGLGSPARGFGVETRLVVPFEVHARFAGRLFFDFGSIRGGYAWIFPGEGFLNLGAAVRRSRAPELPGLLAAYAAAEGLREWFDLRRVRGAALAFPSPRAVFVRGPCLAAGDAAGLTDRLSGEGIWPAWESGRLAGATAAGFLRGGRIEDYRGFLEREILPELRWSIRFSRIQDLFPRLIYRRAVTHPRRAGKMLRVALGDLRYRDLFRPRR